MGTEHFWELAWKDSSNRVRRLRITSSKWGAPTSNNKCVEQKLAAPFYRHGINQSSKWFKSSDNQPSHHLQLSKPVISSSRSHFFYCLWLWVNRSAFPWVDIPHLRCCPHRRTAQQQAALAAPGVQGCDDETALVAAVKPWLLRHGELSVMVTRQPLWNECSASSVPSDYRNNMKQLV